MGKSGNARYPTWAAGDAYRGRIEVLPVPQLEDEQLPQPQRVIALAGEVLPQQARDERRLEVAALLRARRVEDVGEETRQSAAEPGAERDAEALLAPLENRVRQQRAAAFP